MARPTLIDKYLPEYSFREFHDIVVDNGSIEKVYAVARDFDMSKSKLISMLFKVRGLPTGDMHALAFIAAMGFTNIEETVPAEYLVGFLRTDRIEPVTGHADFVANTLGASLKVVCNFSFAPLNPRQVKVSTETRILCVGTRAKLAFGLYWLMVGPFSRLIRREMLKLVKLEAERLPHPGPPGA
jgi:hypothetical protein